MTRTIHSEQTPSNTNKLCTGTNSTRVARRFEYLDEEYEKIEFSSEGTARTRLQISGNTKIANANLSDCARIPDKLISKILFNRQRPLILFLLDKRSPTISWSRNQGRANDESLPGNSSEDLPSEDNSWTYVGKSRAPNRSGTTWDTSHLSHGQRGRRGTISKKIQSERLQPKMVSPFGRPGKTRRQQSRAIRAPIMAPIMASTGRRDGAGGSESAGAAGIRHRTEASYPARNRNEEPKRGPNKGIFPARSRTPMIGGRSSEIKIARFFNPPG